MATDSWPFKAPWCGRQPPEPLPRNLGACILALHWSRSDVQASRTGTTPRQTNVRTRQPHTQHDTEDLPCRVAAVASDRARGAKPQLFVAAASP